MGLPRTNGTSWRLRPLIITTAAGRPGRTAMDEAGISRIGPTRRSSPSTVDGFDTSQTRCSLPVRCATDGPTAEDRFRTRPYGPPRSRLHPRQSEYLQTSPANHERFSARLCLTREDVVNQSSGRATGKSFRLSGSGHETSRQVPSQPETDFPEGCSVLAASRHQSPSCAMFANRE
jgi:hypothetical protein